VERGSRVHEGKEILGGIIIGSGKVGGEGREGHKTQDEFLLFSSQGVTYDTA
jgi:hypothetical protein